jgi:periplasmic divalent cation tolerance protein
MRKPLPQSKVVVVLVTCPTRAVARRLANGLVSRRLAACVNVLGGVESVFWWKGKTERCREVLLLVKTAPARVEQLRRAVLALHPYEVPEIIVVPIVSGHTPYLQWVVSASRQYASQ